MRAIKPGEKVVFRKVGGRVVPIRVKDDGSIHINGKDINASVAAGVGVGGSAYAGMRRFSRTVGAKAMRFNRIGNRYLTRMEVPRLPAPTKIGRKTVPPDIFEMAKHAKEEARYAANQARGLKFRALGTKAWRAAGLLRRHALKVGIGAGLLVGAGTLLFGALDDD